MGPNLPVMHPNHYPPPPRWDFPAADKTGSVWRVLSTALLHRTFFQPFAHPVPMPQNPASPFYTPMTIQRCVGGGGVAAAAKHL